jgi:hypothetical protein
MFTDLRKKIDTLILIHVFYRVNKSQLVANFSMILLILFNAYTTNPTYPTKYATSSI